MMVMPETSLCVHCRQRPEAPLWRPFCSERCKMADLGRWLSGDYRVPVRDEDRDEERPRGVADAAGKSDQS